MSLSPIIIVGSGLAGLTLGRSLRQKGIPAIIYTHPATPSRCYDSVTLRSSTYRKLLPLLELNENTFRQKVAVDSSGGGRGRLSSTYLATDSSDGDTSTSFRCNRWKLDLLLREGQNIQWKNTVTNVEISPQSRVVTATLRQGERTERVDSQLLVACDGPHSVTRQTLSPTTKLKVLPYVVFNGKRRYSHAEYRKTLAPYLQDSVVIQTRRGDALLGISLSENSKTNITVSYTYSRPVKDGHDLLFRPERPFRGATEIREEFYEELEELDMTTQPFRDIFDAKTVRKDRIIHWLMRSLMPDREEAQRLAALGVILIGDAAHAMPILGGEGANVAITDALELAEHIAERGVENMQSFVSSRFELWENAVINSERRLKEMHSASKQTLEV